MSWYKFWHDKNRMEERDPQKQIGRTLEGIPVSKVNWDKIVEYITKLLKINNEQVILDLCCGNGLLTKKLAAQCKSIVAVDYSKKLLENFNAEITNISKLHSNVLDIDFDKNKFDVIIIYFAIQYFSEKEVIAIIGNTKKWLKDNGILFIGDIPDIEKKWTFYSNRKYQKDYFNSILNDNPIIGTWFQKQFFHAIGEFYHFSNVSILNQKTYMINHKTRFDVLFRK